MMKIIHTSDWHLGRSLHGEPLVEPQAKFLEWFVKLVKEEAPDLVVIAGDVHDRSVPSVESIELFGSALLGMNALGIPILVSSGNHDSRVRLGQHGSLLDQMGLHIRTRKEDVTNPVVIESDTEILLSYGIPYLDPTTDAGEGDLQWNVDQSHTGVLNEACIRIRADVESRRSATVKSVRVLVACHAFLMRATTSESERNIAVGGLGEADSGIFWGFDYVAMGHLHGPQIVKGPDETTIRYSGSPLRFSFSEQNHQKSVLVVDLDESVSSENRVREVDVPQMHGMRTLKGTFEDLVAAAPQDPDREDWIAFALTNDSLIPNGMATLKRYYPNALKLEYTNETSKSAEMIRADIEKSNPADVVARFVTRVSDTKNLEHLREAIDDCCNEVELSLTGVR
jgi:exonuclease SbcD